MFVMVITIFLTSFPHFISKATFISPSLHPPHRRTLEAVHSFPYNILALRVIRHIYTVQIPTTNTTKMAIV